MPVRRLLYVLSRCRQRVLGPGVLGARPMLAIAERVGLNPSSVAALDQRAYEVLGCMSLRQQRAASAQAECLNERKIP